jgi:ABC-type bacteriocin/lantibiotic exporter with double-glycine peptidase domain
MYSTFIQQIHERILTCTEQEYNLTVLKKIVKPLAGQEIEGSEAIAEDIIQTGREAGILYLRNELSLQEFYELLQNLEFPILLFKKYKEETVAIVIQQEVIDRKFWRIDTTGINEIEQRDFESYENLSDDVLVLTCVPNKGIFSANDSEESAVPTSKTPFQRFLQLIVAERKEIGYLYVYAIIAGLVSLSLPLGIQSIIGLVSSGQISTSVIVLIFFIVLGLLLSGGLQVMQLYMVEYIQMRLFTKSAFDFAFRLPRIKSELLLNKYPPEMMNRFFDVVSLQKSFSKILIDFSAALLQIFFGMVLLSLYHPLFLLLGTVLLTLLWIAIRMTGPKALDYSLKESKYKYATVHWLEEIARSLSTFKLASYSNVPVEKTDGLVTNYLHARKGHFKVLLTQYWYFIAFKVLITGGLLIMGSYLLISKSINLGQFVASEIIIILLLNAVEKMISQLDMVYDMLTSVEKLGQITDLPIEYPRGINADQLVPRATGLEIKVNQLNYKFPDNDKFTLKNISFNINKGQKVVLTGYNNSGKTTLLNVMLGYYSSFQGIIAYNGVSLKNYNHSSLIKHIGDNISQEDIFESTITDNITMGRKDIPLAQVQQAIDAVGLTDFVLSREKGLDTILERTMHGLSDVIIQRLILARSIASSPALLLIEDFVDGMKSEEKERILSLLFDHNNPCTLIMVSDHEEVLQKADSILHMSNGKLRQFNSYQAYSTAKL